ncbi:MAG TPA: hypothetical protein VGV92_03725 [Gammaproteobacteria bacterium]|nr:hypothetical protein [Gammaproteobacteria bacterium]
MFSFWKDQPTKNTVAGAQLVFGLATVVIALKNDMGAFLLPAAFMIAHAICILGDENDNTPTKGNYHG